MPLRFRQRLLDHLAHENYHPTTIRNLTRDMSVAAEDRDLFAQTLSTLEDEDRIEVDAQDMVRLPSAGEQLVGRLKVTSKGFGFVIPDEKVREGDIFIPPGNLADAVTRDRVRISLVKRGGRDQGDRRSRVGRVIEIVERGHSKFVGVLRKVQGKWWVEPDGTSLRAPVLIGDPHAKGAKSGSKVAIELVQYPERDYVAEGVIIEVLGKAGKPDVETRAVITAHGLSNTFVEAVQKDARGAATRFEEELAAWEAGGKDAPVREDLRGQLTLTIDPPDAKDFDDAITIEHDEKTGEWTLGVHIADVANFVRRGTALDDEAYERGNSTYLPRLVLPMLPEVLSNGVCSLQEGVPRFTKSAFITFSESGRVLGQRLCASVIKSDKRLTYLEAQALIGDDEDEARKHARTSGKYTGEIKQALDRMNTLARLLKARRHKDGMIVLNLPEVDLVFDDAGHVTDVVPEDDAFTHTIIEMFMVEANEAVARTFDSLQVPIIRRIHPDPSLAKTQELQTHSMVAGMRIPDRPSRRDIQELLEATRDSPVARAIHFAVLRTMSKATYSPALIGHYALASDHYAHFTSPIRRYPDLSVHRTIEAFVDRTENGRKLPGGRKRDQLGEDVRSDTRVADEERLISLGRHCSDTEQNSEEAERELREFLVLQFLQRAHLGDVFPGVVTGVMGGGVFVSIDRFLAEGLVKTEDLPGRDVWRVDGRSGRLAARKSGLTIGMGDPVKVQIVSIDTASREMDLIIVGFKAPSGAGRKRGLGHGDRPRRGQGPGGGKRGKGRGKGGRG